MKFSVCLAEDAKRTAKQVLELLSSAYAANKEFVIVSHATDDFDSLASIKAVLFLLETIFGVGAKVFFDHPSEEAWIIRRDGGICDLRDYLEQVGRENVFCILVDANDINSSHVNEHVESFELPAPDLVVDHHVIAGERSELPGFEIRNDGAASAVALLLEILETAFEQMPEVYGSAEFSILATLAIRAMPNDVGVEVGDVLANWSVLGPRGERYWPELYRRVDWELFAELDPQDPRYESMEAHAERSDNQWYESSVYGYFLGVYEENGLARLMARFADAKARELPEGSVVVALAYVEEGHFVREVLRQNESGLDLGQVVQELFPKNGGGRRNAAVGKAGDPYYAFFRWTWPMLLAFWDTPRWFSRVMLTEHVQKIAGMLKKRQAV